MFISTFGFLSPLNPISLVPIIWLDGADVTSMTTSYFALGSTVSGTSGLLTLVCSGDESANVLVGMSVKISSTDVYTVAGVSTTLGITTITVSSILLNTYTNSALAVLVCNQLSDKSGNGYNAVQATALHRMFLAANNIGNANALICNDIHSLTFANIPNTYQGFSCFAVMKYNQDTSANATGNMVDVNGVTANVAQRQPLHYFQKSAAQLKQSVGTYDAVATSVSAGQNLISYIEYDGVTTINTSVNSTSLTSQAITQLTSSAATGIIGSNCKGSFGELLLYPLLNNEDFIQILSELSVKWGITTT